MDEKENKKQRQMSRRQSKTLLRDMGRGKEREGEMGREERDF